MNPSAASIEWADAAPDVQPVAPVLVSEEPAVEVPTSFAHTVLPMRTFEIVPPGSWRAASTRSGNFGRLGEVRKTLPFFMYRTMPSRISTLKRSPVA